MAVLRCTASDSSVQDASTDGSRSSFAFLVRNGSLDFLAISDLTDVGLSSALHAGLSFFGHPNAAPPTRLAVMFTRHKPGRSQQRFHVLQCSLDDLGSLYTPAV
jgi:hypothetical protein